MPAAGVGDYSVGLNKSGDRFVIQVRVQGIAGLQKRMRETGEDAKAAFNAAIHAEAEAVIAKAKEIVPVASGNLRNSLFAPPPAESGDDVTQLAGSGGAVQSYAVPVHEIPPPPMKSAGGRSARHRAPGQWKYLEKPFTDAQAGMLDRIKDRIASRLAG